MLYAFLAAWKVQAVVAAISMSSEAVAAVDHFS
jgi:hypothetical protein